MKKSYSVIILSFIFVAFACDTPAPEAPKGQQETLVERPSKEASATTKSDSYVHEHAVVHDAGPLKKVKPVTKKSIKTTTPPKNFSVYDIPKQRPSQEKGCKEKADFSEIVYQKALAVAQKKSCQKTSDCMLVRNTTNCVMKSSCNIESYEGVYKTHAKRLIDLRGRLYNEVCPGCKKWTEKCRRPPMTARCTQRSCEAVIDYGTFGSRLKIGKTQPANAAMRKTFVRRTQRLQHCGNSLGLAGHFTGGTFQYEFTLNDEGDVTTFKTLKGEKYKKVNDCLVKILKPYRYPKPQDGENQFRQAFSFRPK